jgi:hypothetical protein
MFYAKTLDSSDKKATELVSAASQFFADNSEHMVDLIKNIVVQGMKSGSIKNSESDITNFAEHCVTTIKNFTKVANGQEKQIRFTPLSLRAALSPWMRSKKGYAIHRAQSVEIMPSQSSQKGILNGNCVNEGKCAKLNGWFWDNHVSKSDGSISGHLMHDELKLGNDANWNCSNNHMVGLAASVGEFNKLLPETEVANLFLAATAVIDNNDTPLYVQSATSMHQDNNHDKKIKCKREVPADLSLSYYYKPATYVNLWRLRTTKNVAYNCEFFFNNGSLTGDELLRQFLRVVGHCELIGISVLGLLNDAAGQNVKLVDLLTSSAKTVNISATGYPGINTVTLQTMYSQPS